MPTINPSDPPNPSLPDPPPGHPPLVARPAPGERLRTLTAVARKTAYSPFYTLQVRRLRVILPTAALLTLAVVFLWPRILAEFNHPTETSEEERKARMINGRFVGSDAHGRPYTVTYDSAEQAPGGGPVDMVNPIAELTLENGRWVAVKAAHGLYDQANGTVDLTGHVELFHDEGYRFTTERAHIEFAKNLVWGDRAITGRGPKGEIAARGFRVVDKGSAIAFTGPTRLLIRPDAAALPDP